MGSSVTTGAKRVSMDAQSIGHGAARISDDCKVAAQVVDLRAGAGCGLLIR